MMIHQHTLTIQMGGVVYGYISLVWIARPDYIEFWCAENKEPPRMHKDRRQKVKGLRRYKGDFYADFILPFIDELSDYGSLPVTFYTKTLQRVALDLDFKQLTPYLWIRGDVDSLMGSSFYVEPRQILRRVESDLRDND